MVVTLEDAIEELNKMLLSRRIEKYYEDIRIHCPIYTGDNYLHVLWSKGGFTYEIDESRVYFLERVGKGFKLQEGNFSMDYKDCKEFKTALEILRYEMKLREDGKETMEEQRRKKELMKTIDMNNFLPYL